MTSSPKWIYDITEQGNTNSKKRTKPSTRPEIKNSKKEQ